MKPGYINTLNLNSLFVLKRRTMTHYKIFVQEYPSFSFRNHLISILIILIKFMHAITIRLKLCGLDHDTDSQ